MRKHSSWLHCPPRASDPAAAAPRPRRRRRGPSLAPWLALVAGVVLLAIVWPQLTNKPGFQMPWGSGGIPDAAALVGSYEWRSEAPLDGATVVTLDLVVGGDARVTFDGGPSGLRIANGTWASGASGLRLVPGEGAAIPFASATFAASGLTFDAADGRRLEFVRKAAAK